MSDRVFNLESVFRTKVNFQSNDSGAFLYPIDNAPIPKLESNVQFEVAIKNLNNNLYDITLVVILNTRDELTKDFVYSVCVNYTGIFSIAGFNDKEMEKLFKTHASTILYPYCRSSMSELVNNSQFPNVVLPLIDFFAIYEEHQKEIENKKSS